MSDRDDSIKKLIPAAATLGAGPILKAIGKFIPGIGSFVSGAYTAGYAADQILDFVKDKLETPAQRRDQAQLQSRAEQGIARPDEQSALSQIEQGQSPINALMGIGKLGAQAAGGIASARAGAAQQAQEQQIREEQLNQERQSQEKAAQRQTQQDQFTAIDRQNRDIARKEESDRKKRAEERAIEKHQLAMNKPGVKKALNKRVLESEGDLFETARDIAMRLP